MQELKVGLVGLDTSHVVCFAGCFNDPADQFHVPGVKVVKAFPGGSETFSLSRSRVAGFTADLRDKYGVEIVSSIEELAGLDAYLLESVDGAQHLEQFKVLAKFGKPVFIDKPLACSYSDARTLFDFAAQYNVPIMTASSMRFAAGIAGLKPQDETVAAAEGFGPMAILDDYRDYFWYGIHSAEIVYSYLGRGCAEVHTESNGKFDLVVGRWNDGRLGLVAGNRVGANNFGVRLTTDKRHIVSVQNPDIPYMFALAQSIDCFFRTGISPIDPAESLEVIAFLEAASRSRARGGVPVVLADL